MRAGGIWHVILFIILASLVAGAIQLAIIFLIGWGLLFRTRQTIGVLSFCSLLGLLDTHPWACVGLLGLLMALVAIQRRDEAKTKLLQVLPERVDSAVTESK